MICIHVYNIMNITLTFTAGIGNIQDEIEDSCENKMSSDNSKGPLTAASTFAGDSSFGLDSIDIILKTMLST